ncbi:hypothetical protein [Trichormus variabilis]|uniref:Uncharacterized protein n=1 Tax=Trichormus variabilis SAG 1403-4b TaxID=447716 RepID=A0A3S1BYS5_ANAVA|nr:hypothetical protein [Trichormus variabilis]MBD2629401.1 hypothetical protein [Trichormus variabilis FACHB-164]RUS93561.1 hypothetical protein DSM107003_43570 [Trichormus variabilis SAG 1403-4b]
MISTIIHNQKCQRELFTKIPVELQWLSNKIKSKHYDELYEGYNDTTDSLEDDLQAVLEIFGNENQSINHIRYIWMTLIISLAVEPTLEYYDPNNNLPKTVIQLMEKFLYQSINGSIKRINQNKLDQFINEIFKSHESYFQKREANFQAISEALDVFYNAIRVLNYDQSLEAMLEILEDCLEGDAIFPGSYGRRELFDWWLLDVVPASYNLLPPKIFYVVEGVKNKEEIRLRQTRLLSKISKKIWSSLPALMLESNKHNNYIFPNPGKINRGAFKKSVKIPDHYHSKSDQFAYSR